MALHPSKEFESLLHDSLPDYAADAFLSACDSSAKPSVRLNPFKPVEGLEIAGFKTSGVPWCKDAFFLDERKPFTLDPAFHAGAYYVQDSSSMFLSWRRPARSATKKSITLMLIADDVGWFALRNSWHRCKCIP